MTSASIDLVVVDHPMWATPDVEEFRTVTARVVITMRGHTEGSCHVRATK
jgi:hypothetical protein